MSRLLWALSILFLLAQGCSYTFDGSAPEIPLIGEPPDLSTFPRLNRAPADDAYIVYGHDNRSFWLAMLEPGDLIRVRRLSDPPMEEELRGTGIIIRSRGFYQFQRDLKGEQPTILTIRSAGEPGPGQKFQLPPGEGRLYTGPGDRLFVYWTTKPAAKSFLIIRRDGSFRREVPFPEGLNEKNLLEGGFFEGGGRWLFVRDKMGKVRGYSTSLDREDLDLGPRPRFLTTITLNGEQWVLTCGEGKAPDAPETRGLRLSQLGGTQERVLDEAPCSDSFLRYGRNNTFYYKVMDQIRQVSLLGGEAPRVIFEGKGKRILTFGPEDELIYSTNGPEEYVNGAGDGWLGDWQFMERGRLVTFSVQGTRLRFLEHAATALGSGDLLSVKIPFGQPTRLARNVYSYSELIDGRIVAMANYAFWGTHNRIIVIDEERRVSRYIAGGASYFMYLPNSDDILVFMTLSSGAFDLVRVPIPPRDAP